MCCLESARYLRTSRSRRNQCASSPLSSEPKCACCQSSKRSEVEALLARRGQEDGKDRVITWPLLAGEYVPALLGRPSISISALKRHMKHVRVIEDGEDEVGDEGEAEPDWMTDPDVVAVLEEIRLLAAEERVPPGRLLGLQQKLYLLSLKRTVEKGQLPAVTHDQAARAAASMMQGERAHGESVLLGALGSAIGRVFSKQLSADHDEDTPALPQGDLIEGEVVREETEVAES